MTTAGNDCCCRTGDASGSARDAGRRGGETSAQILVAQWFGSRISWRTIPVEDPLDIDLRGVPQDYVSAHMWLNLAAATGDEEARKARERVAASMTREQLRTAEQK